MVEQEHEEESALDEDKFIMDKTAEVQAQLGALYHSRGALSTREDMHAAIGFLLGAAYYKNHGEDGRFMNVVGCLKEIILYGGGYKSKEVKH